MKESIPWAHHASIIFVFVFFVLQVGLTRFSGFHRVSSRDISLYLLLLSLIMAEKLSCTAIRVHYAYDLHIARI